VSGRAQSLGANFDLIDPQHTLYSRGAAFVQHVLAAVGSRSVESAQNFINQVCEDKQLASKVIPYGSYQALYDNPQVDCIYIGEPIDNICSSWPLLETSGCTLRYPEHLPLREHEGRFKCWKTCALRKGMAIFVFIYGGALTVNHLDLPSAFHLRQR
jgi:hypothetical protein